MTQTNGTDHGDELPETIDGELESMVAPAPTAEEFQ